jgi:hypothetical protein
MGFNSGLKGLKNIKYRKGSRGEGIQNNAKVDKMALFVNVWILDNFKGSSKTISLFRI